MLSSVYSNILRLIIFFISISTFNVSSNEISEYHGYLKLKSNNLSYPVISKFETNASGTIIGTYELFDDGDNDGYFEDKDYGVFYDGVIKDNKMVIYWSDKWGNGKLNINFIENMNKFEGICIPIENGRELKASASWNGTLKN